MIASSVARLKNSIAKYFDDRGIVRSASPGNHLNALIARRILVQDERGVGFRHRPFQDVMAATLMRVNAEFASQMLADPPRFASVIRHTAWLGRDDKDLLERVRDATSASIQGVIRRTASVFDQLLGEGISGFSEEQVEDLLRRAAPPSAEERERAMEEHYEYREMVEAASIGLELPFPTRDAIGACAFLSDVLAGSELVADVALKTSILRDSLRGWTAIAEELGAQGHEWTAIRPLFNEILRRPLRGRAAWLMAALHAHHLAHLHRVWRRGKAGRSRARSSHSLA